MYLAKDENQTEKHLLRVVVTAVTIAAGGWLCCAISATMGWVGGIVATALGS